MRGALALALLLPLVAAAQPVERGARGRPLSPAAAVGVSVAVPAAGVALALTAAESRGDQAVLLAVALAVGPSTGNLIQGQWDDAALGAGLRMGGAVLTLGALLGTLWNESEAEVATLEAVAVAGGGIVLTGVAYDVVTAGLNARVRRVTVAPAGAGIALRVGL